MRTASGTRPITPVPRAMPHDDEDPTALYHTQSVEIVEGEPVAIVRALRRARMWNAVLGGLLAAIVVFAVGWWLGGGK